MPGAPRSAGARTLRSNHDALGYDVRKRLGILVEGKG